MLWSVRPDYSVALFRAARDGDVLSFAGHPGAFDAVVEALDIALAVEAKLGGAGVGGIGVVFDDLFPGVCGSDALADFLGGAFDAIDDDLSDVEGRFVGDGFEVVEAGEQAAAAGDVDFEDPGGAVGDVFVDGDVGDAAEGNHIFAAGRGGDPELRLDLFAGLIACRILRGDLCWKSEGGEQGECDDGNWSFHGDIMGAGWENVTSQKSVVRFCKLQGLQVAKGQIFLHRF